MIASAAGMGYDFPDEFCQSMVGTAETEIHLILRQRFGADFPIARLFQDCELQMQRRLDAGVPVKAGAAELIGDLAARKSADGGRDVDRSQDRRTSSASGRACSIISAPSARARTSTRGKPHPDLFLKAASELGVRAERCLVLEDSYHGVRAAHAAGAMPVMVPDLLPATDELRALCVAVVRDLHDVRAMLNSR